ncbi:Oxygen sensor histidine kinase NreB OS=Streptomyces griseomycini OX=66895 GN=FHS37_000011 PE=4 SV=1 [Streptomyces griseomycini]
MPATAAPRARSAAPPAPAARPRPAAPPCPLFSSRPRAWCRRRHLRLHPDDEELLGILAQHAAIALTNARLYERSRELTIAEERSRLAHELHDAVSQKLFSLRLTAQAAARLVDRDPSRAKGELQQVAALAAEAADELRAAVVELRPAALDEDGLVATLRTQIQVLDRAHTARVTFAGHGVRALPAAQEEAVLRVAQEALHNALRHSGADHVDVTLDRRGGGAVLRVTDDGIGFDPRTVRRAGRHLGLVSMRDRASGVGGRMTVESAPGKGTTIEMEVPGG